MWGNKFRKSGFDIWKPQSKYTTWLSQNPRENTDVCLVMQAG